MPDHDARLARAPRRLATTAALALVLGTAWPLAAAAQPVPSTGPTAADKSAARALVVEGRQLLEEREIDQALDRFERAHAIMGVPSTGYDVARARQAKGLLVEAYDMARQVTLMPEAPGEPDAFPWARAQAKSLIGELEPRLPTIRIVVQGADGRTYTVTIDGEAIAAATLSQPRIVNPGAHDVAVATLGADEPLVASEQVVIDEGHERVVVLVLPAPVAAPVHPDASAPAPPIAASAPPPSPDASDDSGAPIWPWITGGIGVAFAGVAVGMAVDFASAQSSIDEHCAGTNSQGETFCDPAQYSLDEAASLFERRNRARGMAVGFGAAGAALVGAGIVGLVIGGDDEPVQASAWHAPDVWALPGPTGGTFGAQWRW